MSLKGKPISFNSRSKSAGEEALEIESNTIHYSLQPQHYYHRSYFFIVITSNTSIFVKLAVPSSPVTYSTLTHPLPVPNLSLTFTLLSLNLQNFVLCLLFLTIVHSTLDKIKLLLYIFFIILFYTFKI